jgi:osmotically-inducible protein OsmY
MKRLDRSPKSPLTLLILIGIMVIATLVVMSNYFLRPGVESDLNQEIVRNLRSQGLQDAMIKVSGRDVKLTGSTTNHADAIKAEKIIQDIWGINQIENNLVIKKQTIE